MTKRGVCISDSHAGNIYGVTPPDYWRKPYTEFMQPFWEWYEAEAKQLGRIDFLVHNAESVDGLGKKEKIGLWTDKPEEQEECAAEVISVWDAEKRYMTRGSTYHSVGERKYDDNVARMLEAYIDDEIRLEINGVRFQFRHVAPRSDTQHGQASQLFKEATREAVAAIDDEYVAADVVVRSHNHYYFKVETFQRTAVITPSLELRGAGVNRHGSSYPVNLKTQYYHVGYIVIEVEDNGEVFIRPRRFPMKVVRPVEYVRV